MKPSLLAVAEQVLNAHVHDSTAAMDRLSTLEGKRIAVDIAGLGITIVLSAKEERLRVELEGEAPATATVRGTPLALLASLRGDPLGSFGGGGLAVTGDAEVAEEFSTLLRLTRPDLEEQLSHIMGDVLAHQIENAVCGAGNWGEQALTALCMNTSEFLQEESRQLPARVEVDGFFTAVEILRDDAERVAVKIDRHIRAADRG